MAMSLYELSSETFAPMLRALSDILDKGIEHAHAHGLGERELPEARLAPDMYTLTQQVQLACSNALEGVARVTGRHEPQLPNDERTLDDLKRCIARTIEQLDATSRQSFEGADARKIEFPFSDELEFAMTGAQFLRDWAIPHFYFHVVTAYDILRHRGVVIGKQDYLARVGVYIRRRR